MKTRVRRHPAAFTLIELMAVITIIVILAGIVIGGMGYVSEKQARAKAQVQIALLSKALEEYKLDNGTYPPTANKSGTFTAAGTSTSAILFKALYFDSDNDGQVGTADTDQRIYIPELDPANSKQGWTVTPASAATKITDPWGNEYCYRTAFGTPPANGAAPANPDTQNPDFDLWSAGKDGKSKPGTPADPLNKDDIR
jgi:prepilin-type N-terminal cleavage/methylation domain-containing protein